MNRNPVTRYLDTYDVSFSFQNEYEEVAEFIDKVWKAGHPLAHSKKLFDWQHYCPQADRYNFIVARDIETKKIAAGMGFVAHSVYDKQLFGDKDSLWGAIWKVGEGARVGGLGYFLQLFIRSNMSHQVFGSIGLSEESKKIFRALKFKTGILNQYYIKNPKIENFQLLGKLKPSKKYVPDSKHSLKKLTAADLNTFWSSLPENFKNPIKSPNYYLNRYLNHPVYRYETLGCLDGDRCQVLIIVRTCEAHGAKALRGVDVIGDTTKLADFSGAIATHLAENNFEYFDLYTNAALDTHNSLFSIADISAESEIVPNYFEPFVPENVVLDFGYTLNNSAAEFSLFKGDCDMDRPNTLKGLP